MPSSAPSALAARRTPQGLRAERVDQHGRCGAVGGEAVLAVASEPPQIGRQRLGQPGEDLVLPSGRRAGFAGQAELALRGPDAACRLNVDDPARAIPQQDEEVGHVPPGTLGPARPQERERLGRDPNDIPVMVRREQEVALQQALEPNMGPDRAGPPPALIVPLARPRKERPHRSADSSASDARAPESGAFAIR
jgi:hypothetical protein